MKAKAHVAIPPLCSSGLMLTYRCTNACRHCLYYCSPRQPDEWLTVEMAERIFAALGREHSFSGLHFAGGEATLNMERLLEVVRLARQKRVPIDYLETNASWCDDYDETVRQLRRLKDAGLLCVLVSVCMYHNEFVPFSHMKNCIHACREVLGPDGAFVYPSHLYTMLERLPDEGTHSLREFCEYLGIGVDSQELHALFPLIPGGRAVKALRGFYKVQPVDTFARDNCGPNLQSPHHAHLDLYGNLFTGGCAGICPGTVDNLHPQITEDTFPVFWTLCHEGPVGLLRLAPDFIPDPNGYAGKCDVCFDVRKHLHATGEYPELRPASFYEV